MEQVLTDQEEGIALRKASSMNKRMYKLELFGIPLNDGYMLLIYLIIAGIFAFLALYYHQKYGERSNE